MSLPAIEVSGLSKRYVIEHESRHDNLRDTLHHTARKLWRRFRWGTSFEKEEFLALRDVSFSVQPGEVIGIIGRNGAGKSTLLKILSRITEPTSGRITLRGRVASLLEVGTGFHPDLTGRENIYLNGAILGMSRAEIRAKFDEIVAFAEIERFLDTPVKRYSSGMYVRLAFAVAAHLEPEILIVDEVLAVGDQQFQAKCLGKIREVSSNGGRTVLFVSHNLSVIQSLCKRAILLRQGAVVFDGPSSEAVALHLQPSAPGRADEFSPGPFGIRIDSIAYRPDSEIPGLEVDVTLRAKTARAVAIEFVLIGRDSTPLAFANAGTLNPAFMFSLPVGDTPTRWTIDVGRIATGAYFLTVKILHPMVEILAVAEHLQPIEITRPPLPPATRSLELSWGVGACELDVRRR
jgi:ABC-type polysaccharide/polyol phosphate transport system ATPase subunit